MSSSAESQRFDATAAAQQMLALEAVAEPLPAPATPFPAQSAPETAPAPAAWPPPGEIPGTLTDRGSAKLFVRPYRDRFRHVEGLGWYSWDGYRWKRTGGEKAALWAAGEMAEEIPDTDPRGLFSDRELHHHKKRTMSTTGMKALLTQAKASPDLSLDPDTLDGDPLRPVHPGRRRRPPQRPHPDARPHPGLPFPGHQRRPPEHAHPPADTASWTTPSARTPKAGR